jgi:hypothetical protein
MLKKDVIDEFYYMTMFDLAHDVSREDVYDLLKDYESKEMYDHCAGLV